MEEKMQETLKNLLETCHQKDLAKPNTYSPLVLAYIGDAVYEMFVRTAILKIGNAPVNRFHKTAREWVRASKQAEVYHKIEPHLTEDERAILKRGRNAKSFTTPKNGDVTEYRHATGVEALIGYLYLSNQMTRIIELMEIGLEGI